MQHTCTSESTPATHFSCCTSAVCEGAAESPLEDLVLDDGATGSWSHVFAAVSSSRSMRLLARPAARELVASLPRGALPSPEPGRFCCSNIQSATASLARRRGQGTGGLPCRRKLCSTLTPQQQLPANRMSQHLSCPLVHLCQLGRLGRSTAGKPPGAESGKRLLQQRAAAVVLAHDGCGRPSCSLQPLQ